MKSLFCILVTLFFMRDSVAENKAVFSVFVKERGRSFREKISLDLDFNSVQYSTPNHLSVLESQKVQDFNLGLQLICFPSRKRCFMLKLNRAVYPDARTSLQSIATAYRLDGELSFGENTTEYIENWYTTGKMFDDLSKFGPVIRDFHAKYGYPVYEVKKIPKGAIVLEGEVQDMPLAKRQLTGTKCYKNGRNYTPVSRYGSTPTVGCDYITFCNMATGVCDRPHVQDRIYYSCLCCSWHKRVSQCLFCTKL